MARKGGRPLTAATQKEGEMNPTVRIMVIVTISVFLGGVVRSLLSDEPFSGATTSGFIVACIFTYFRIIRPLERRVSELERAVEQHSKRRAK